jgi:hypothetical protein
VVLAKRLPHGASVLTRDRLSPHRSLVRARRTRTRADNGRRLALGEPRTKKSRRTVGLTHRAVEALRSHRARQAEEKL